MKKIHINLTDELHEELKNRAKNYRRTMQDEVVLLLERGMGTIEVPVIGRVDKDGTVQFDPFWNTTEGMKEAAERG
jgi:plasmid stability protein